MFSPAKMIFTCAKYPCARVTSVKYFVFTCLREIRMVVFRLVLALVFVLASLLKTRIYIRSFSGLRHYKIK